jgi:tetratricopeptide (TPR) repeat protein
LGQQDTSLERQEFDLFTQRLEKTVNQIQTQVNANPSDAALQSQLAQATQELDAYRLQTASTLVERYPNDYAYRFDLGKLLLGANRLDESIQQLQYAQRNPKYRQSAILLIGKAFVASGKFDLAVEQFNVAKGELPMMNDLKKDVIYELGNAFEKMGRTKEAIEEYKIIYMADSGFRDVAQKINAFYESQKGPTA